MPETIDRPFTPHAELITGVPEFPITPMAGQPEEERNIEIDRNPERKLYFPERMKLGQEELAICGVIDLNPAKTTEQGAKRDKNTERVMILDVGFKRDKDGRYGPYDIDGSGVKRSFDKPYVLLNMQTAQVDGSQNAEDKRPETKFIQVDDYEEITLGRGTAEGKALGLISNDNISRNHVSVRFGARGVIEIKDLNSTNGSAIYAPGELVQSSNADYGYTDSVSDNVHNAGKGDQYVPKSEKLGRGHGEYAGRPIIARDTEINGGVYPVGGSHGEAIVIDDAKYPEELDKVYEAALEKIKQLNSAKLSLRGLRRIVSNTESEIPQDGITRTLESVFDIVTKTLRYDLQATNELASDSQKIALNYYINEGVGVCRTQAVLAAYTVERLMKNGLLEGNKVSIDRSSVRNADGEGSGHAWARFTDKLGNVFIIDPAQKYVGPIDHSPDRNWDYRRTEDIIKQLAVA